MIRSWLLLPLILLVHLILLINTRFTLWPEMVVYPYLLNNGFLLYRDIINPYSPLLSYALAIFARIFGYQPFPYQILTWGIILITDLVIFITGKKIFKKNSYAFISTLFFTILSIPFSINVLWFDLIQTPIIVIAFYYFYKFFLYKKPNKAVLFFSIFFLTIAFFIKQQVLWLFLWFFIVSVIKFGKKVKNIFIENAYVLLPFAVLLILQVLFFWQKNLVEDFLFWVFYFPFFKASKMPGYILLPTIRQFAVLIGLFLLFTPIIVRRKFEINLIVTYALTLILFAYPRFDYFHLIPSIALLSIAFGPAVESYFKRAFFFKPLILAALIYLSIFTVRYFINNWQAQVRFFEPEILTAANFLRQITNENEPVYIQNGPDQLLPLSGRIPVKPWADEFPWYLELQGKQEKIVESLKEQNPRFVVYKPYDIGGRYDLGSYRPEKIAYYLDQNYQKSIQISDSLWLKIRK